MGVTRAQKLRLGIFVTVGLTVLVGGLVILAGMKLGKKKDLYYVRFSEGAVSLNGLDVGSPVKYSGIRIGRVESIKIDPKDVSVIVVTLAIDGGTPIAEDSVASLANMGITGLKYVELSRGSRTARVRKPGEEIPAGQSFMDEVQDQATEMLTRLNRLVEQLNGLAGPETRARIDGLLNEASNLLEHLDEAVVQTGPKVDALAVRLDSLGERLERITKEVERSVEITNGILAESRPKVAGLFDDTRSLMHGLEQTRARLDQTIDSTSRVVDTMDRGLGDGRLERIVASLDRLLNRGYLLLVQSQEDISDSLEHLKETSENMSAFSQRIREDPSLLFMGAGEEDGQ